MGNKQHKHKGTIYPDEIYNLKIENKNIPFEIAQKYFKDFNSKIKVEYICAKCNKRDITQFQHLKERSINVPYCNNCWLKIRTSENSNWLKKNSDSQLVIQNLPEVKKKNVESVKKFWRDNPDKLAAMREKILANPNVRNYNYNNGYYILEDGDRILFESSYELIYIWYCEQHKILIRRFNKKDGFIKYFNVAKMKESIYKPDFMINEDTIVEIKGTKINKVKEQQLMYEAKRDALIASGRKHIFLYKSDIKKMCNINRLRKGHRVFDSFIHNLVETKKIEISSKKYKEYYVNNWQSRKDTKEVI